MRARFRKYQLDLLVVANVVLVGLAVLLAQAIESRQKERVRESLASLVNTTAAALRAWAFEGAQSTRLWAEKPDLVEAVRELLALPPDPIALREAPVQAQLREQMRPFYNNAYYRGYYVVGPGNINLAGSRDSNIGSTNLLAAQPAILNRLWAGVPTVSQPLPSDVPLSDPAGREVSGAPTLFTGAPVRGPDGAVIALLLLRVDPEQAFFEMFDRGHWGRTGETYAINRAGLLLSDSRFESRLQKSGRLTPGEPSSLHVAARPPGGDSGADSPAPLTHAAAQVVRGETGYDPHGYRNYLGDRVLGSWIWLPDMELGIISEIGRGEALAVARFQNGVLMGLTLVCLLFLNGLVILNTIHRRRNTRTATQLEGLIRHTPAMVVMRDLEGNVILTNDTFRETVGIEADKGRQLHCEQILPAEDLDALKKMDAMVLKFRKPIDFEQKFTIARREHTFMSTLFPVLDETGEPVSLCMICIDITERKQAEEALIELTNSLEERVDERTASLEKEIADRMRFAAELQESEERFRILTDNAPEAILVMDAESRRIVDANRGAERLFKIPRKDFLEADPARFIPRRQPDGSLSYRKVFANVKRALKGEAPAYELFHHDSTGRGFPCEVRLILLPSHGKQLIRTTIVDITERKKIEAELAAARDEANRANRAKSDFLANMSHEIRTPMNAVLGMTHLALKTEMTDRQRDYLDKIQISARSLLGIIDDILDFSKIEAGRLDLESVPFDLEEVFQNLAGVVTNRAEAKGLELLFKMDPDVPTYLLGDPLRLGQVLINLCSNAVKFTEKGEILVSAELAPDGDPDPSGEAVLLKFVVHDTGIGMSEDQRHRLFQAFSQADTSITRRFGGTGLGLAISKKLCELMEGEIGVTSRQGIGSTFWFTARFRRQAENAGRRQRDTAYLRDKRALVADDNEAARAILGEMLESFGIEVQAVASGEAALEQLGWAESRRPFDFVVLDWKFPEGMDGLQAARAIKREHPFRFRPPIIMVSSFGQDAVRDACEAIGVERFLSKPINPSMMLDSLMQIFPEGKTSEGEARPARMDAPSATEWSSALASKHILVVEDNLINQDVAREILESEGLRVTIAGNGREALDVLANPEHGIDLVLLDLQMPEMDGFQACREIRGDPRLRPLPVLAMTAHAMVDDIIRCREAGMDDHIAKPIDFQDLKTKLHKWLDPRARREAAGVDPPPASSAPAPATEPPVFDPEEAMRRFGQKEALFLKIARRFLENLPTLQAEIAHHRADPNLGEIQAWAHTLAGVAGNLSAKRVYRDAKAIELGVADPAYRDQLPDALDGLRANLEAFTDRLRAKVGELTAEQPAPSGSGSAGGDPGRVRDLLDILESQVEEQSIDVDKTIESLKAQCENGAYEKFLKPIEKDLEDFQFQQAGEAIKQWRDALNIAS